ncbi:MAG: Rap1a/Tai family immunity protein [Parvibaculaceae bacterium]
MKKSALLTAVAFVVSLSFASSAFAAIKEAGDISTGNDLAEACTAFVSHDVSQEGSLAADACKGFLGDMVRNVVKATQPGAPTVFNRVGPKQDTSLCFQTPTKLSFEDFAKQVLAYHKSHPELDDRPAYETGAWSLSTNYPCPAVKAP